MSYVDFIPVLDYDDDCGSPSEYFQSMRNARMILPIDPLLELDTQYIIIHLYNLEDYYQELVYSEDIKILTTTVRKIREKLHKWIMSKEYKYIEPDWKEYSKMLLEAEYNHGKSEYGHKLLISKKVYEEYKTTIDILDENHIKFYKN